MSGRLALPLPWCDPAEILLRFADCPDLIFFDSATRQDLRGRYSYLCPAPQRLVLADACAGGPDPLTEIRAALGPLLPPLPDLPPFQGGAAGLFSYDLGRRYERLADGPADDLGWPVCAVGLFEAVIAWDHQHQRCWCLGKAAAARALQDDVLRRLAAPCPPLPPLPLTRFTADQDQQAYQAAIQGIIDAIYAGDIFQANLSQRFTAPRPADLDETALYLRLRQVSPAPFAALVRLGAVRLLSASPERFLRTNAAGQVEARPIKGTIRRSCDPAEDTALAAALLASDKDRAENLMIVDLLRNDLARSCALGSVRVPDLFRLESYAGVHHLVSVVTGQLRPEVHALDLLRDAFPGGSITGAPKIHAMDLISAFEPVRRGPYCGSLAWIGWDGAMDSSILIRTLVMRPDRIHLQTGGGITALSDPAAEVRETHVKAAPLRRAVEQAK